MDHFAYLRVIYRHFFKEVVPLVRKYNFLLFSLTKIYHIYFIDISLYFTGKNVK